MEGVPAVGEDLGRDPFGHERALAGCEGRHLVEDRPNRMLVGPHADVHFADADNAAVGVEPDEPDGVRVSPAPGPHLRLEPWGDSGTSVQDVRCALSSSLGRRREERPAAAPQSTATGPTAWNPAVGSPVHHRGTTTRVLLAASAWATASSAARMVQISRMSSIPKAAATRRPLTREAFTMRIQHTGVSIARFSGKITAVLRLNQVAGCVREIGLRGGMRVPRQARTAVLRGDDRSSAHGRSSVCGRDSNLGSRPTFHPGVGAKETERRQSYDPCR